MNEIILNGTLVGGSDLSINAMNVSSRPSQKIFYLDPDHGIHRMSDIYLSKKPTLSADKNGIYTAYTWEEGLWNTHYQMARFYTLMTAKGHPARYGIVSWDITDRLASTISARNRSMKIGYCLKNRNFWGRHEKLRRNKGNEWNGCSEFAVIWAFNLCNNPCPSLYISLLFY